MPRPRLIPILLCQGGGLVKTCRFQDPIYLGDPLNALRIFNEKEADELVILDIAATAEGRRPDVARLGDWAAECFMPLTYGGGIASPADAERCLRAGIEKIAVQSASNDPEALSAIARLTGRSSVVVSVDVRRDAAGTKRVAVERGRRLLATPLADHLAHLVEAGAGEILIQDIDREGTASGCDLDLVRQLARVPVPIIFSGGVGGLSDVRQVMHAGASAVGVGRMVSLWGRHRAPLITYPSPNEIAGLLEPDP